MKNVAEEDEEEEEGGDNEESPKYILAYPSCADGLG